MIVDRIDAFLLLHQYFTECRMLYRTVNVLYDLYQNNWGNLVPQICRKKRFFQFHAIITSTKKCALFRFGPPICTKTKTCSLFPHMSINYKSSFIMDNASIAKTPKKRGVTLMTVTALVVMMMQLSEASRPSNVKMQ
jgi:hypothetical protein